MSEPQRSRFRARATGTSMHCRHPCGLAPWSGLPRANKVPGLRTCLTKECRSGSCPRCRSVPLFQGREILDLPARLPRSGQPAIVAPEYAGLDTVSVPDRRPLDLLKGCPSPQGHYVPWDIPALVPRSARSGHPALRAVPCRAKYSASLVRLAPNVEPTCTPSYPASLFGPTHKRHQGTTLHTQ